MLINTGDNRPVSMQPHHQQGQQQPGQGQGHPNQPHGFNPQQHQQQQHHQQHSSQHQQQQSMISPDEASDRQLLELLQMMDNFTPVVPDALMDYLMVKSGVECDDVRLKRLVALVAQKYVTDIANDAMHYSRQRQSGAAGAGGTAGGSKGPVGGSGRKTTLTMEDLTAALSDHGINIKRPNYFM